MATDSSETFAGTTGVPSEVVEQLLADERRRLLLSSLADNDGEMAIEDLAAAVCRRERSSDIDDEHEREVYDDIYDRHLPKLTATGVVAFDSLHGSVRLVEPAVARDLDGEPRPQ